MGDNARQEAIAALEARYHAKMNKKKRRALLEASGEVFEAHKLGLEIAACMKSLDLDAAFSAYVLAKAQGVKPDRVMFTNLLCLTAGLGEQGCGSQSIRQTPPPQDIDKAFVVFEDMRNSDVPLSEAAFTSMIRCCSQNARSQQALLLYRDMLARDLVPRIRTLSALLALLAAARDAPHCEEIFAHITDRFDLLPTEKEFSSMLVLYAQQPPPRPDAQERFLHYLRRMADELLVLSHLETVAVLEDMLPRLGFQATRSAVSKEGLVECSQEQLRSIDLDDATRARLLAQLETFAVHRDPNHRFKPNNKIRDLVKPPKDAGDMGATTAVAVAAGQESAVEVAKAKAKEAADENELATRRTVWAEYQSWLAARHASEPFDLIVDGANVGYYKQNYPGAPKHVSYEQIDHMMALLRARGHRPLLVLHSRHLSREMVPDAAAQALVDSWRRQGWMYATPRKFNDDWFWMFAAIQHRCRVVTNDELRDHHFQLFSPRCFLQWRERARVMYEMFSHFQRLGEGTEADQTDETTSLGMDEGAEQGKVVEMDYSQRTIRMFLRWPRPYSHRVQYVAGAQCEGWYVPPLVEPSPAPVLAPLSAHEKKPRARRVNPESDADESDEGEGLAVGSGAADASGAGNEGRGDGDERWWCFFRPKTSLAGEKRKREGAEGDGEESSSSAEEANKI